MAPVQMAPVPMAPVQMAGGRLWSRFVKVKTSFEDNVPLRCAGAKMPVLVWRMQSF
jgi:hypothetical protein